MIWLRCFVSQISGDWSVSKGFSKSEVVDLGMKPTDLGSHSLRHTHVRFGAAMLHYRTHPGTVNTCDIRAYCSILEGPVDLQVLYHEVMAFSKMARQKEDGHVVRLLRQRMETHTILRGWIAYQRRYGDSGIPVFRMTSRVRRPFGWIYIATSPHLTSKSFGWNPPKMNWHFRNHMFNSMLSWSSNWHQTCRCSLNQKGDIGIWWDMWYLWKRADVSVMCRSPDVLLQWRTASLPLQMLAPRAVEMRKRSGTLWHWTSHKIH